MTAQKIAFAFLAIVLSGCTSTPPAPPPAPPAPPPPPKTAPAAPAAPVGLEPSYRIAKDDKELGKITHIPAVLFSKDGKRLYTATSAGRALVWDSGQREIKEKIEYGSGTLNVADFAGERYVVAIAGAEIIVTDLQTKKLAAKLSPGAADLAAPSALAAQADGKRVAIGRADGSLELRALPELGLIKRLEGVHKGDITALAIAPGGKRLASAGRDGKLLVFGLPALAEERSASDGAALHAVAFSPDGTRLAFGGEQKKIREIDLGDGKDRTVAQGQPFWITALGYGPDGSVIAAGDESCDVWLFEAASGKQLFHGKHHGECWVSSVTFAPDGERFVFGCRPNSHAGVPAQWTANVQDEALSAQSVKEAYGKRALAEDKCWQAWEDGSKRGGENAALRARVRDRLSKENSGASGAKLDEIERGWLAGRGQGGPAIAGFNGVAGGAGGAFLTYDPTEAEMPVGTLALKSAPAATPAPQSAELKALKVEVASKAVPAEMAAMEKATAAHAQTYLTTVEELRRNFLVNEWRYTKK